jgi:multiple antibiotic resistance protein
MTLLFLTLIFFLTMDPIGNVSPFLTMVQNIDPKRYKFIILREMSIALVVMLAFYLLGEFIFDIFHMDDTTLRLTSAVILFLTAIKILFPTSDGLRANITAEEPYIIPLAIPLTAGPSLLATILLFSNYKSAQPFMVPAIFIAWIFAVIVLLCSRFLKKYLTDNGLMACERLMGMILIMMAIQRFLEGIKGFIECNLNC